MARPVGSPNKDKPFRDALRIAIAAADDNPRQLRKLAEKLYDKAEEGDVQAIREVADRLDGKVAQAIIGGDDDDNPVQLALIERRIIDANPSNPDSTGIQTTPTAKPV